ncbi:C40 family peptidase [Kitasatospora viridis]|uniref:NlpC/P60 family protein n=1 Tax=Kitasatospora viridis TaxID=281105 RepID=A0A561ULF3_9ACTN|nr:C40 family peptidase [Kitasatospora viridis]TWG00189.1 NlpC/P60 family protein [Kitasatospora viridis]
MGTRRKPRPTTAGPLRRVLLGTAAASTAALAAAVPARAEPAPTVAGVKQQVDQLNEQAESSIEKYNGLREKQDRLQQTTGRLQDRVAATQQKTDQLRGGLGAFAAQQYRGGGIDPSVQLLLNAAPDEYLERAATQDQVSSTQAGLLRQLAREQRSLDQDRKEATDRLAELDAAGKQLAEEKRQVQAKLDQAQQLLNRLTPADRAAVNAADPTSGTGARAGRSADRPDTPAVPAGGRAAAAVQFAYAQLGKPYVWGATGPGSFDCSGLTGAAWRAAGVSLPRVSEDQWNAGRRIARADLQPGDLVFFYGDLHHVGIYIGNGQMIHAPRTGKNVTVLPIDAMPSYMGAVRP